jgi:integrase
MSVLPIRFPEFTSAGLMKLNAKTISRLALPAGKTDHIIFDEDLPGFGIRLRGGGKITWIIQYRVGSKQRRVTLGTVKLGDSGTLNAEEAREAARDRLAQVQLGGDPQKVKHEARAKAAMTLGAVVDTYLSRKEPELRVKTLDGTVRYLRQHWKSLHGLPIHEITRRDVAIGLGEISTERGLVAAARARAALSALFAWAVREGIAEANPVVGTNRPAEPKARDRVLSDAELAEIWAASRDDDFGRIVRLLVLVGARREEIGGLTWNETDTGSSVLTLPGTRTKNGRPHTIPLAPLAQSIIEATPRREGYDHLFGKDGFSGWSKAKAALDTRIATRKPMQPWRLHDLRRTFSTRLHELGVQPHIVEAVLNHVSGHKAGVAGVYNRAAYEREVKAALALWADHVSSVVEGTERKVVPLRPAS